MARALRAKGDYRDSGPAPILLVPDIFHQPVGIVPARSPQNVTQFVGQAPSDTRCLAPGKAPRSRSLPIVWKPSATPPMFRFTAFSVTHVAKIWAGRAEESEPEWWAAAPIQRNPLLELR